MRVFKAGSKEFEDFVSEMDGNPELTINPPVQYADYFLVDVKRVGYAEETQEEIIIETVKVITKNSQEIS